MFFCIFEIFLDFYRLKHGDMVNILIKLVIYFVELASEHKHCVARIISQISYSNFVFMSSAAYNHHPLCFSVLHFIHCNILFYEGAKNRKEEEIHDTRCTFIDFYQKICNSTTACVCEWITNPIINLSQFLL